MFLFYVLNCFRSENQGGSPSQTLPNHQVPLIGHLHRHHPPAPSSLILGSLSLSPSTRHHPSSHTGNLRACPPSLPRRPSQTTRCHSLGTSTDTTLQPPAHSFSAL